MQELLELLIKMRTAQKEYYQMKTQLNLKKAIQLEKRADELIKVHEKGKLFNNIQKELFDETI